MLIGPPASGKGTQGDMLNDKYSIPLISGGALLRALPESHPRHKEINDLMSNGEPAPQDFLAELYKARIMESDCDNGFILDGWGRKLIDLKLFDPGFDLVIVFDLPREEALKRISGRRICDSDGEIYNIYTLSADEIHCDGNLIQRDDDKEEVVNHRLDLYEADNPEVLDYLESKYKVVHIDATPMPDEIFAEVDKHFKAVQDSLA